ncbi:MAG: RNA ligase family protein [Candidatus Thorarchaeota archaeon]|jgi:RNA ligase (TIGR02306 family)
MSTFRVDVVPVHLEVHPNADTLSLVRVMGYTVVVKTAEWKDGDLGAYIPPDSLVSTKDFPFIEPCKCGHPFHCHVGGLTEVSSVNHLITVVGCSGGREDEACDCTTFVPRKEFSRITVRRFRKVWSEGLLTNPPEGAKEGDDVAEQLGVTHYEPEVRISTSATDARPPKARKDFPIYDVENIKRFPDVIKEGEPIVVTEKIHGANARFNFSDGEFHVGSRRRWVRQYRVKRVFKGVAKLWKALTGHYPNPKNASLFGYKFPSSWLYRELEDKEGTINPWWKAMQAHPGLLQFLKDQQHLTVYGEIYGPVQELKYGVQGEEIALAIFDIWDSEWGIWRNWEMVEDASRAYNLPLVPVLFKGPFNAEEIQKLSFGKSAIIGADHHKEGVVVRPLQNRRDHKLGRVQLKVINNEYLEGKKKKEKKK